MKVESITEIAKIAQVVVKVIREMDVFGDKDTATQPEQDTKVFGGLAGLTLKDRLVIIEELVNEWSEEVEKEKVEPPTKSLQKIRERKVLAKFQKLISENLEKEK
jgi:hypothetical protein